MQKQRLFSRRTRGEAHRAAFLALLLAVLSVSACSERSRSKDDELVAALSASASASAAARRPLKKPPPPMVRGLLLAVLAGQGTGPIRIGANVTHIERLMSQRCEVRSENLCRYVTRGIDFHLLGNILQWIHIQRAGRPAGKNANGEDIEFGFFYGQIPPDLRLGMTPEAIREYLGKPYRAEKVAGPNPQNTVWLHYYPGMVLEYDYWHETKKLILGGIRIVRDPNAAPFGAPGAGAVGADAGAPVDAGAVPDAGTPLPKPRDAGPPPREPEPR